MSELMDQISSKKKAMVVVIAAVASALWASGVAVYFYNSREPLGGQRAEAALPAPPAIKKIEHVDRHFFEQDFELVLTFDDGSKLTGTASAKSTGSDLSWGSGEILASLLTDHTGVLWLPVDTSGKDHKKEWTSKVIKSGQDNILQVRFKIYPNK